jgi:hypothetical protein
MSADERDCRPGTQHEAAAMPYAIASGLFAAFVGGLVSLFVPGPDFLVAWGVVSAAVACAAGWHADRLCTAALQALTRLSRSG